MLHTIERPDHGMHRRHDVHCLVRTSCRALQRLLADQRLELANVAANPSSAGPGDDLQVADRYDAAWH